MEQTWMQWLTDVVVRINGWIWGIPMPALIVGTSVYFTWKLKWIQKYCFQSIILSVKKSHSSGMISNFASMVIALAAMVGTGKWANL